MSDADPFSHADTFADLPDADLPDADLCLVPCVKTKREVAAPARELYQSDYFRKMRDVVERTGWQWCILSAKHGLVEPDQVIAPYDKTLNKGMTVGERREWARSVMTALEPRLSDVRSVVVFTGKRYQEFLTPALEERGITVHDPMKGMGIGKRKQWLGALLETRER